ncbi:MAG: DUF1761 domain-containing protein [Gammaproteobacteria bacterium]|nr:DUF1761 domain-containing protein [Gammaproteobacteria bacterium]
MPKLFGTNILIILLAAFLFFVLGAIWYGGVFHDQWLELTGVNPDPEGGAQVFVIGFVIVLLQALGIAGIVSMAPNKGLRGGLKVGMLSWLFFALPISAYAWNYEERSVTLLQIDAAYLLVGYLIMGAVYGLLRKE